MVFFVIKKVFGETEASQGCLAERSEKELTRETYPQAKYGGKHKKVW